jgi:hypothetical protein
MLFLNLLHYTHVFLSQIIRYQASIQYFIENFIESWYSISWKKQYVGYFNDIRVQNKSGTCIRSHWCKFHMIVQKKKWLE